VTALKEKSRPESSWTAGALSSQTISCKFNGVELPPRQRPHDPVYESQLFWWTKGYETATGILGAQIDALQNECDRLYRAAYALRVPLKHGRTFAQLCRERGETALAERVEADMNTMRFEVPRG
jgi:hypothetical protein